MSGHFKLSKISPFSEMQLGDILPKSDLAIQDQNNLYQFTYVSEETKKQLTSIKPGTWIMVNTQKGVKLEPVAMTKKRLLLDVANTSAILEEANCFFNNLDVYRELERPLKRGVLLYSEPGLGKSSTISWFCDHAREEDAGTVVIIWPTSKVDACDVEQFFSTDSEYAKEVTRLILVIEDISGGDMDGGIHRKAPASLLNLLDGVTVTFRVPTFIISTTNHPQNLLKSLADRPGRFDLMMELRPPSAEERVKLLAFIAKRELTEEECEAVSAKDAENLSIAHLDEVVVRSRLHKKSIPETLREILKHREFCAKGFDRSERTMGLGADDDDY